MKTTCSKMVGTVLLGCFLGGFLFPLAATAADGAAAKGSPVQADRCNKELKWAVSACDREFREHQDTRKHADCLAAARSNYDTCMDPGAK
ncbi:MAG: hypothetical protein ACOY8P_10030 [Thermodesulfobacteriota bacterium]